MKKTTVLVLALTLASSVTGFADIGDILLGIPSGAKVAASAGLSIATIGFTSFTLSNSPADASPLLLLPVPLLFGTVNVLLLRDLIADDPKGVRMWRTVAFFEDAGLAALAAAYDFATQTKFRGVISIFFALPMVCLALLDLVPFPMEARAAY